MSLKPIGARALIEPEQPKKTSEGGIELPEQTVAGTVEGRGTILAFGCGDEEVILPDENVLHVGDTILYKPHAGYGVTVHTKSDEGTTKTTEYLIVRLEDIIAVDDGEPLQ